jgi:hypothetical protein
VVHFVALLTASLSDETVRKFSKNSCLALTDCRVKTSSAGNGWYILDDELIYMVWLVARTGRGIVLLKDRYRLERKAGRVKITT